MSNNAGDFSIDCSDLVSIIMPAFNAGRFMEVAVDSVRAQSYSNWELLIANDASTDSTLEIASCLAASDSRIRVLNQVENRGVAAARNLALGEATGKYVAFLDSDDVWNSDKLTRQIEFMNKNEVLVCYSAYQRMDESGVELGKVVPPVRIEYTDLLKSNFIGNLTGVYNAEVLGKQYFLNTKHEDYVAWLNLVKKARSAQSTNSILAHYRVHSASISSNKIETIAWQWRIYRSSQSLGILYSCCLMLCYFYYAIKKRT